MRLIGGNINMRLLLFDGIIELGQIERVPHRAGCSGLMLYIECERKDVYKSVVFFLS
jgi:hypothetical protein